MGSAEFEFGAVHTALRKIAVYSSEGRAYTGTVHLARDVPYLCEAGDQQDVEGVIRQLAADEWALRLQEPCWLKRTIAGEEHAREYGGWLELDNGFMFFADDEMYRKTLRLFDIPKAEESARRPEPHA